MLDHISIRDFAIIDNVEIDLQEGFSVITGETGSGKSIVVTAISLALGSRADSSYVRSGKDKAIIELTATLEGEPIVISREITSSGKNLCKLNGRIVTLAELSSKCEQIADIHGQYDNQSLLNPENHIKIVDNYLKDEISPLMDDYHLAYSDYLSAKASLNDLLTKEEDSKNREDFLRYEIKEIETASPILGEDSKLTERLNILQNSERIFKSSTDAYAKLMGDGGAYENIGTAVNDISQIAEYSSELEDSLESLNDIYYKIEDIASSLRGLVDDSTFTPDEIDVTISRLNQLDNLKKKYAKKTGTLNEVLDYKNKLESELSLIDNMDHEKNRLSEEYQASLEKLSQAGDKLTKARLKSAYELKKNIKKELEDLNFENSDLDIVFDRIKDPSPNGMDSVEILISLNPGEPLKPLAKTSSGGELSRIMLAIKKITAMYDEIPTLIFDEIDQGISGRTAAIVARKLREISRDHQVISITHLPQIAAAADEGYRIYKESDMSSTYTHVERLDEEGRIIEIARLLAGENLTDTAMENARNLVAESLTSRM